MFADCPWLCVDQSVTQRDAVFFNSFNKSWELIKINQSEMISQYTHKYSHIYECAFGIRFGWLGQRRVFGRLLNRKLLILSSSCLVASRSFIGFISSDYFLVVGIKVSRVERIVLCEAEIILLEILVYQ